MRYVRWHENIEKPEPGEQAVCREISAVLLYEDDSPFRTIARLTVPSQDAWSAERSAQIDGCQRFGLWHGIEAHRPLGASMRARKLAYAESAGYRRRVNRCPLHESQTPRDAAVR